MAKKVAKKAAKKKITKKTETNVSETNVYGEPRYIIVTKIIDTVTGTTTMKRERANSV